MSTVCRSILAVAVLLGASMLSHHADAQDTVSGLPVLDESDPIQGRQPWMIRTARIEGAAGNVQESASALQETAARILSRNALSELATLVGDGEELNRRVHSARLAAEVLDQPL